MAKLQCADGVSRWLTLLSLGVLVLGAAPLPAQRVAVGVGLMPTTGPASVALEDARVASVRLVVTTLRPGTTLEVEVLGLQGRTTTALSGDVAVGGSTRRTGGVLVGLERTLGVGEAKPYARLSGGLGAQTGQSGGRLVGRVALGIALARWPAFGEVGGMVMPCTTAYRSEKTCAYAPLLVGWRFQTSGARHAEPGPSA